MPKFTENFLIYTNILVILGSSWPSVAKTQVARSMHFICQTRLNSGPASKKLTYFWIWWVTSFSVFYIFLKIKWEIVQLKASGFWHGNLPLNSLHSHLAGNRKSPKYHFLHYKLNRTQYCLLQRSTEGILWEKYKSGNIFDVTKSAKYAKSAGAGVRNRKWRMYQTWPNLPTPHCLLTKKIDQ